MNFSVSRNEDTSSSGPVCCLASTTGVFCTYWLILFYTECNTLSMASNNLSNLASSNINSLRGIQVHYQDNYVHIKLIMTGMMIIVKLACSTQHEGTQRCIQAIQLDQLLPCTARQISLKLETLSEVGSKSVRQERQLIDIGSLCLMFHALCV